MESQISTAYGFQARDSKKSQHRRHEHGAIWNGHGRSVTFLANEPNLVNCDSLYWSITYYQPVTQILNDGIGESTSAAYLAFFK